MSEQPSGIHYETLTPAHFEGVITLGNFVHGDNYLTEESLRQMYDKSFHDGINASWVALDNDNNIRLITLHGSHSSFLNLRRHTFGSRHC